MTDVLAPNAPVDLPSPLVEAAGVCKAYRNVPVLFPLDIRLEGGQALAVLGPNGSGKTTLLRLLAGAVRPSEGSVRVCGREPPVPDLVGLAGHATYLYDDLTGFENLQFFARLGRRDISAVAIAEALETVGMLAAASERVRTYSAGMKRRLGLARLLLAQPGVLLLDEPHASLDAEGRELVDAIVTGAVKAGRAVLIASHERERALALCGHALVLEGGRALFQGTSEELANRSTVRLVRESS